MLCSRRKIIPSVVTLLFILCVESKLRVESFWDELFDLLARNRLKTSSRWNTSTRWFCMYLIIVSVWYLYCAIRWKHTKFLTHNRASVEVILWLSKWFEWVTARTGTITHLSAFISLALHCITWRYGLLNQANPGYGGIFAQSWWNLSILQCCSRKDITQSTKCSNIPR